MVSLKKVEDRIFHKCYLGCIKSEAFQPFAEVVTVAERLCYFLTTVGHGDKERHSVMHHWKQSYKTSQCTMMHPYAALEHNINLHIEICI